MTKCTYCLKKISVQEFLDHDHLCAECYGKPEVWPSFEETGSRPLPDARPSVPEEGTGPGWED